MEKTNDLFVVKIEACLEVLDLSKTVQEDYEILSLPKIPTIAQIKNHKEKKNLESKKSCLFAGVSNNLH